MTEIDSEMTDLDWEDIKESEFVDFATSLNSVSFIFEHEEMGLHGFEFIKDSATLKPALFEQVGEDE